MFSRMKKSTKIIFGILVGLMIVATFWGGYIYYIKSAKEPQFAILLTFQNTLKTLCFSPKVTIEDLVDAGILTSELLGMEAIWIYLFSAVIVLVPIFNILFILSLPTALIYYVIFHTILLYIISIK